jgi:uncharacterized protein YjbJ (UPF0337 family)
MSTENTTKKVVDDVAGAGTADKIGGKVHEVAGKAKEAVGDLTDNPKLKAEGEAEQGEGKLQNAMGTVSAVAHGVVDAVADGAHKLGDAVKHMIHHDDKKD